MRKSTYIRGLLNTNKLVVIAMEERQKQSINKIASLHYISFAMTKMFLEVALNINPISKYFLTIYLLFISTLLSAQSLHFSQYGAASSFVNPANAGNFNGDWRFGNIIREQGGNFTEPFTTVMLGFDKHFYVSNRQISAGVFYLADFSASNTLVINKLYFSCAYKVNTSVNSKLRFGIMGGVVTKNSSYNNLSLPEQYDMSSGTFNSQLTSSEMFLNEKIYYPDIVAGLIWQAKVKGFETEIGASAYQLNKAQETFFNTKIDLPVKYVLHGSLKKMIKNNLLLKPQFYYVRVDDASELLAGTVYGYEIKNGTNNMMIYASVFVRSGIERNNDATIIGVGIEYKNWNICFGYDYDISGLHTITSRSNAFEISIIYIRPETFVDKTTVPCDLY